MEGRISTISTGTDLPVHHPLIHFFCVSASVECIHQGVDTGAGMVVFDSPVTIAIMVDVDEPNGEAAEVCGQPSGGLAILSVFIPDDGFTQGADRSASRRCSGYDVFSSRDSLSGFVDDIAVAVAVTPAVVA